MLTLPVLVYHIIGDAPPDAHVPCNYVRPSQFEAQLRFLSRAGFTSISLRQYVDYRRGNGELPARPIVITFDDGYRSSLEVAAPLLEKFGFGATVFVVTDCLGRTNIWDPAERQHPLLNADDIRKWTNRGIEFESHTASHCRLPALSNAEVLGELVDSRRTLEAIIDRPVSVIAYPWGDRNEATCELAKEAGYSAGVIVRRRTNFDHTPLFELRRIGINSQTSLRRFVWDLARLRWRAD